MGSIDDPPTRVTITVMGGFGVVVNDAPTAARGWVRRDAAALVKVLALVPGHRLHRERMMDLLWPGVPPVRSAPRLHKAAHFARRASGRSDAIVLRGDLVRLFPDSEVIVDAIRFEQLARSAVAKGDPDAAREALSWYRGELLPSDRYADWAADRRELLHLRRLDVLRVAAEWRELAELDPTDEEAHVQLMRRHLAAGQATAAIRQYDHLQRTLERQLSATPGPAARQARLDADHLHDRADGARSLAGSAMFGRRDTDPQHALIYVVPVVSCRQPRPAPHRENLTRCSLPTCRYCQPSGIGRVGQMKSRIAGRPAACACGLTGSLSRTCRTGPVVSDRGVGAARAVRWRSPNRRGLSTGRLVRTASLCVLARAGVNATYTDRSPATGHSPLAARRLRASV